MLAYALLALALLAATEPIIASTPVDGDRDGLDDSLEQALLERFRPKFLVSSTECDVLPAEFLAGKPDPVRPVRNGAIYGQVFPTSRDGRLVEIHYYHLWASDCGMSPHPLDVEHVSVRLETSEPTAGAASYRARYWLANAHRGTVCDAAQGALASTLSAETAGATIWISHGKHASFLSQSACGGFGCGGDACRSMSAMPAGKLINLGEPGAPLNGALWTASPKWDFKSKMTTEFPPALVARLDSAPPREIVTIHPALVPAKAAMLGGSQTLGAVGTSGKHTGEALETANRHASSALGTGASKSGEAIGTSVRKTGGALKAATGAAARALGLKPKQAPANPEDDGSKHQ